MAIRQSGVVLPAFVLAVLFLHGRPGEACSRISPVALDEMIAGADLVVRVRADDYASPPLGTPFTPGFKAGSIRFMVLETLKGVADPADVVLPGSLTERDDFNDHGPPYRFVRPAGREGNCFADAYRRHAEFLLFLVRQEGHWALYPEALGPVNEQLRGGAADRWVAWVKAALAH